MAYDGTLTIDVGLNSSDFQKDIAKLDAALKAITKLAAAAAQNLDAIAFSAAAVDASVKAWKAGSVLTGVLKAFQEAKLQVLLYAASVTGTITAEKLQTAALSAKEIIMGGLTKKISLATAAQYLWNNVIKANPIGLFLVGITAVVAGLSLLINALFGSTEEYKKQKAIVEELSEEQKELNSAAAESAKAYKDKVQAMHAEAKSSEALLQTLTPLIENEHKSADEKARLSTYVKQLNQQYDGLNLAYDEENDLLSMNIDEVVKYIAAQQKVNEVNAYIERQSELLKENAKIQENLTLIEAQRTSLAEKLAEGAIKEGEYNEILQSLTEAENIYIENREELNERLKIVNDEIQSSDIASSQQIIEDAKARAAAQEEEMQRRKDALQSYSDTATNMFQRIKTESDVSVTEMISNLQYNQEALGQWADNLVALGARGLDKGLLQQLRDAGPESAATVAALVNATGEELAILSETFANGGDVAAQALATELGLPEVVNSGSKMVDDISLGVTANDSLDTATTQMIQDAKSAAENQVKNADFASIGHQIINGITAGVNGGLSGLVSAMISAVSQAANAAKTKAKINSPSKLFRDLIGLNMMHGWALGIEDGQSEVNGTMKNAVFELQNSAMAALLKMPQERLHDYVSRMQAAAAANQARFAFAGNLAASAPGNVTYGGATTNLYQTIHTHDSLSPAEMTLEAQNFLKRSRWKNP